MEGFGKSIVVSALIALTWGAVRTVIAVQTGIPSPMVHDEFSYLVGADTFASGRLVNPAHPMAEFFESPHVLVRPVYASKYPPGNALLLALGQKLFGAPFWGVVLECMLLIFTAGLALSVWARAIWARATTTLLACHLLPPNNWSNSYWGGALAAAGGALILLALGLHRDGRRAISGFVWATGVSILFLTRPYEGAVFMLATLPLAFVPKRTTGIHVTVVAALPVLLATFAWLGYYNRAVTGNPLLLPYVMYDRQYNVTPPFWLMPLRPEPQYSHPRLAAQHGSNGWEVGFYHAGFWKRLGHGIVDGFNQTAGLVAGQPGLVIFLVPLGLAGAWFRRLSVVFGVFVLALSIEVWHFDHYYAPALGLVAILTAMWLEELGKLNIVGTKWERLFPAWFLLVAFGYSGYLAVSGVKHNGRGPRDELIRELSSRERPQLVLVHYPSPDWQVGQEWVYNSAHIDRQHLIFAHDLGEERDALLLNHYPDRDAWLARIDERGYQLERLR